MISHHLLFPPVHVVEVVPTTKDALRGDRLDQRHGSSAGDWLLTYWRMNLSSGFGQIQTRLAVDHGCAGALRCLAADQPH